ncbi:20S-pre-rRNA D-site endonuclease Nob1p [Diutina catenulata]
MPVVESLVLDAAPLLTQSASALMSYASKFYTTPGVRSELKDEQVQKQLAVWGSTLEVRHPKQEYINRVTSFAKATGDYNVLSLNDLHIIALAYEIDVEVNGPAENRLRSSPGQQTGEAAVAPPNHPMKTATGNWKQAEAKEEAPKVDDDGFEMVVTKKKGKGRRGGKPFTPKEPQNEPETTEAPAQSTETSEPEKAPEPQPETAPESQSEPTNDSTIPNVENLDINDEEEFSDDGEWITPENLAEEIQKSSPEVLVDSEESVPCGLATGDFACQNVALQIGLALVNPQTGRQISEVRNFMYRCHACFKLTQMAKSGKPQHFCPSCGGNTLMRITVSVDSQGRVIPHLKRDFKYIQRGNRYSIPSPLSKNQQRLAGKGGYQHNKEARHKTQQDPLILRADQKEYDQALKQDDWERRTQEKMLAQWVGGGSADNYISPFGNGSVKHNGVRVGKSRYANSSKGKRK